MNKIKKFCHDETTHCEIARGTLNDNYNYCTKEGIYVEFGKKGGGQGKRNDLEEVIDLIKNKKTNSEIAETHPTKVLLYMKHINNMRNVFMKDRDPNNPPKCFWIYGPSGCGKTSSIFKKHKEIYMKDCTEWWDGYTQQEAILIDDYESTKHMTYKDLLKITDRYPMSGQTKGGYVKINSPYIYITHTEPPEEVFGYDKEYSKQILRRLTVIEISGSGLKGNTKDSKNPPLSLTID